MATLQMFMPHGENRVFELDQSGGGMVTDGDVSNSCQNWETSVLKLQKSEAVYFKS
jgi:hypothetical protein